MPEPPTVIILPPSNVPLTGGAGAGYTTSPTVQRSATACPSCGWEDGWSGTPPCMMPWAGRQEDWIAAYRGCQYRSPRAPAPETP